MAKDRCSNFPTRHPLLAMGVVPTLLVSALAMISVSNSASGNSEHLSSLQGEQQGEEYILGPRDKVRVKVFAWRPARDEVFEWKALNDEFAVGASGKISMPLIGEIQAGGSTTNELSQTISDQMRLSLGLAEAPRASVDIVQFRPFYVLGAVDKPGEYAYRPDLTIVQAISIAGGLSRFNQYEAVRLDRENISTFGERRVIEMEMAALVARRARLEAEANGATSMALPVSVEQYGNQFAAAIADERRIFEARLASFEYRTARLMDTKQMMQTQLSSLEKHVASQEGYLQAARDNLKHFDDLVKRKLTTTSRRSEAARDLMLAESDGQRMEASIASAHQEVRRAEMEEQALRDERTSQAVIDLRATQARMDELQRRVQTAESILQQETSLFQLSSMDDGKPQPVYTIIRKVGGGFRAISATETTTLRPGDTLKVDPPSVAPPSPAPSRAAEHQGEKADDLQTRVTFDVNR